MHSDANRRIPFVWLLAFVLVGATLAFLPLWSALLLAAWCAHLARPLNRKLARRLGGTSARSHAAGVLTVVCVMVILVPLSVLGLTLVGSAQTLYAQLHDSQGWSDAVGKFFSGSGVESTQIDAGGLIAFMQEHGESALGAAGSIFGAATMATIFLLVFVVSFYWFLVEGRHIHAWAASYLPIAPRHLDRFSSALFETGHGLLIGFGLTAALQATILTVGYALIGVPQPLALGLLTLLASFVPLLGTGIVWVPVTAALFFVGQTETAFISLGIGIVVSLMDNLMRPVLSRFVRLELPAIVVLLSMLGGVAAFGPGGVLLGPLFVRLAIEGLQIWKTERPERIASATPAPLVMPRPVRLELELDHDHA